MEVKEFKNVTELQDFIDSHKAISKYEIIPVARMFEHPQSKLIVSCISYILIIRSI
jgi:hypothetical protein